MDEGDWPMLTVTAEFLLPWSTDLPWQLGICEQSWKHSVSLPRHTGGHVLPVPFATSLRKFQVTALPRGISWLQTTACWMRRDRHTVRRSSRSLNSVHLSRRPALLAEDGVRRYCQLGRL